MPGVSNSRKVKVGKRYDAWSRYYDGVDNFPLISRPQKVWRRRAVDLATKKKTDTVVDIGTGSGYIVPWIATNLSKGKVIGLDISHRMLEIARDRTSEYPNVTFVKCDSDNIPLKTGSVDSVIGTYAYTSIPNWKETINDCIRILKNGGTLIVLDTGKPTGSWGKIMHAPIALMGRIFGYTDMHLDVIGYLDSVKRIKKVREERYYGTMVYIVEYKKK